MLGSGPRSTPADAARNQRERLYGAMVASCAEHGYGATTVAHLIALAGVSRRDFYKHFADLEACFLATLEEILGASQAIVAKELELGGSVEQRATRALDAFFSLLVAQPAAGRLCLVDSYAAGPAAITRIDRAIDGYRQLLDRAFAERAGGAKMPPELTAAMVGALRKIVHTRLHRGTEAELPGATQALVDLALTYAPPPTSLRVPRNAAPRPEPAEAPHRDPARRILSATTGVVATKGYPATTIADITEAAGASLSTFYAHFDGKAEVFDAALYEGRTRLLAAAMPPFRRARSWPEAIRAVTQASVEHLAAEPDFARLVAVDVYAAGPRALERRDLALEAMRRPIDIGAEHHAPEMPAISREAIISAVYALLCEWVRTRGPERLPQMAPLSIYLALCPFVGPEQACAVANGGRRR